MRPLIVDIIWLFLSISLGWLIFERKKPKEKRSYNSITIIGFISWLVFLTLHRAVIQSRGTQVDALLVGTLFGGVFLLICFAGKWLLAKKKGTSKG